MRRLKLPRLPVRLVRRARPEPKLVLTWGDVWMFWVVAKLANVTSSESMWGGVVAPMAILSANYLLVYYVFGGPEHHENSEL